MYNYYPWLQLLQALLLFLPRFIWGRLEGGFMKNLSQDLHNVSLELDKKIEQRLKVLKFFTESPQGFFRDFFMKYLICEVLNHMLTISQFFILWNLLSTSTFGLSYFEWVKDPLLNRSPLLHNIRQIVFPDQARCNVLHVQYGGYTNLYISICSLPLNGWYARSFCTIW
jgi:hypothetical protein